MNLTSFFTLWLGFGLKGMVGGHASQATTRFHNLGVKSFGCFYHAGDGTKAEARQNTNLCTGCLTCLDVCPGGVFTASENKTPVVPANPDECLTFGACVKHSPGQTLTMG